MLETGIPFWNHITNGKYINMNTVFNAHCMPKMLLQTVLMLSSATFSGLLGIVKVSVNINSSSVIEFVTAVRTWSFGTEKLEWVLA